MLQGAVDEADTRPAEIDVSTAKAITLFFMRYNPLYAIVPLANRRE